MTNSNRIFLYGPFVAIVLIAAGWSAFWFTVAGRIDAELERLDGNEIVPGITLQYAAKDVSGFPFRFDVLLEGVTIAAGETAWRSERIALHAMTYGREHYLLETDGLQTFSWPSADGGPQNIVQMSSNVARASAQMSEGRLARFDLDLINTEGRDAALDAAPDRNFSVVRAQLHLLAQENGTIAIVVSADTAQIGLGFTPAFGPDFARLRVEGEIDEAQTLEALRAGADDFDRALEAWRAAGGAIVLDIREAAWGGTLFTGTGELSLDDQHRLAGLVTASPEDPVSFLGALAQSEMLEAEARTQLGAFREMAAGFGGSLNIPIRLEARLPLEGTVTPRMAFGVAGGNGDLDYPVSGIIIEFRGMETPPPLPSLLEGEGAP